MTPNYEKEIWLGICNRRMTRNDLHALLVQRDAAIIKPWVEALKPFASCEFYRKNKPCRNCCGCDATALLAPTEHSTGKEKA